MSVERVVVHCGFPKTGTKALQWGLWANRERLAARGVHVLRSARRVRIAQHDEFVTGMDVEAAVREVRELAADPTAWAIVVSTESFSQLHVDTMGVVAGRLRTVFGRAPIEGHVYVRNPLDWAQSYSFQRYLGGRFRGAELLALNRSLHDIDDGAMAAFVEVLDAGRLHAGITQMRTSGGFDDVSCHLYDRAAFPGGSVLRDFVDRAGIDHDGGIRDAPSMVHPSLTLEAVAAAERWVDSSGEAASWHRVIPAVQQLAETLGGQRSFLRLSTMVSSHDFVDADTRAFVELEPHLAAVRSPMFAPAGDPDEDLVERYLELVDDQMRLPMLRIGRRAELWPDAGGRVVFRVPVDDRLDFGDDLEARVEWRDGSRRRVPVEHVSGPGARRGLRVGTARRGPVVVELAPSSITAFDESP